jgi:hypothetical protein
MTDSSTAPWLIASDDAIEPARLTGSLTLGREETCDIVLNDPGCSRQHAQVTVTADGYFLMDLGSANGTLLAGNRVEPHTWQWLSFDEPIQLGAATLFLRPAEPHSSPTDVGATQVVSMQETPLVQARVLTMEERQMILSQGIATYVARGYTLESRDGTTAVVVQRQEVNHILHLLVSVFTCGLWVIVWLILAISSSAHTVTMHVDEYGNVIGA